MEQKSNNLKMVLFDRGIKAAWAAEDLKIPRSTFSRYVAGLSEPSVREAIRIAEYLGYAVEDIW